jgi:hypothetical protein
MCSASRGGRAYIMILDTLQGHLAKEQPEEAKRRSAQRRADPSWLALCGTATSHHWNVVGPADQSRSVQELGQHLLGSGCSRLGVCLSVDELAEAVAEERKVEVRVLSVAGSGHSLRTYGSSAGRMEESLIGILEWQGETWLEYVPA